MTFVKLLTAVALLCFLSACKVGGAKIKLPDVVIKPGTSNHCPPGQAKKGNC